MNDEKIGKLNKNIISNKKKIRNLEIRECFFALAPGALLVIGTTGLTICLKSNLLTSLYPVTLIGSMGIGMIPLGMTVSNEKSQDKRSEYYKEIKTSLNELHSIAIDEDKKIMQKRKDYML